MKKLTLAALTITAATTLASCSFGGAGGSNILSSALQGNGHLANAASTVAGAVTSQGSINNLLTTLLGNTPVSEKQLVGTWTYQGIDVAFESENLLAKAGGAVAAGSIEEKLDAQLAKAGIKQGTVKFTFNADHTFTAIISGKTVNGTYTYDPTTRKLNLVAALGLFNQTCTVGNTAKGISLLFPADKILSLATTAGALLGQSNSNLSTISSLLGNYKGMQIGLEMSK